MIALLFQQTWPKSAARCRKPGIGLTNWELVRGIAKDLGLPEKGVNIRGMKHGDFEACYSTLVMLHFLQSLAKETKYTADFAYPIDDKLIQFLQSKDAVETLIRGGASPSSSDNSTTSPSPSDARRSARASTKPSQGDFYASSLNHSPRASPGSEEQAERDDQSQSHGIETANAAASEEGMLEEIGSALQSLRKEVEQRRERWNQVNGGHISASPNPSPYTIREESPEDLAIDVHHHHHYHHHPDHQESPADHPADVADSNDERPVQEGDDDIGVWDDSMLACLNFFFLSLLVSMKRTDILVVMPCECTTDEGEASDDGERRVSQSESVSICVVLAFPFLLNCCHFFKRMLFNAFAEDNGEESASKLDLRFENENLRKVIDAARKERDFLVSHYETQLEVSSQNACGALLFACAKGTTDSFAVVFRISVRATRRSSHSMRMLLRMRKIDASSMLSTSDHKCAL